MEHKHCVLIVKCFEGILRLGALRYPQVSNQAVRSHRNLKCSVSSVRLNVEPSSTALFFFYRLLKMELI